MVECTQYWKFCQSGEGKFLLQEALAAACSCLKFMREEIPSNSFSKGPLPKHRRKANKLNIHKFKYSCLLIILVLSSFSFANFCLFNFLFSFCTISGLFRLVAGASISMNRDHQ